MKRKKMQYRSAAILTVRKADQMTAAGRSMLAAWLRNQARNLVRDGKFYSSRFTARYLYKTSKAWMWFVYCYYVGKTLVCVA